MHLETFNHLSYPGQPDVPLLLKTGDLETGEMESAGEVFPILKGIPRIFPKTYDSRTKDSFTAEWKELEDSDASWGRAIDDQVDNFIELFGVESVDLRNKWVLDVGCGRGNISAAVSSRTGCRMVGLDITDAPERAVSNQSAHYCDFVQADATFPPFRSDVFDFIHASGSLHHTPDPKATFVALSRCLASGGCFGFLVYTDRDQKTLRHRTRKLVKRGVCRMPANLQKVAVGSIATFTLSKQFIRVRILRKPEEVPFVARHRHHRMMARDMYTVPYDFHYVAEDLEQWFEEAGLEVIEIRYVNDSDGVWLLGLGRRPAHSD
jgi:ubiquinone/menaquinone biosynthesis C-methylase UbiE